MSIPNTLKYQGKILNRAKDILPPWVVSFNEIGPGALDMNCRDQTIIATGVFVGSHEISMADTAFHMRVWQFIAENIAEMARAI